MKYKLSFSILISSILVTVIGFALLWVNVFSLLDNYETLECSFLSLISGGVLIGFSYLIGRLECSKIVTGAARVITVLPLLYLVYVIVNMTGEGLIDQITFSNPWRQGFRIFIICSIGLGPSIVYAVKSIGERRRNKLVVKERLG